MAAEDENNFKGLFKGQILLVDATRKLLDLRMPVYLLMSIEGDRLSEIVAMFIVAEETKEVIQATV